MRSSSDNVKHKMWLKVITVMMLASNKNAVNASSRIVGGFICNVTEHPFAVAVYSSTSCGGSLITMRWVLTAAHCIRQKSVKAGKTIIRAGYNAPSHYIQKRRAKLAVVYDKYDHDKLVHHFPEEFRYDIALILVEGSFRKSAVLKPVALPKVGFTKTCSMGRVIGTGSEIMHRSDWLRNRTRFARGFMSRPLKCADMHLTSTEMCAKTFPRSVIDDTIVCTLEMQYGQDACQGDSGGPLVCYKEKSEAVLIGVVSAGRGCGIANRSATYTKVESYLDFINQTIAKNRAIFLFTVLTWEVFSIAIFLNIVLVL